MSPQTLGFLLQIFFPINHLLACTSECCFNSQGYLPLLEILEIPLAPFLYVAWSFQKAVQPASVWTSSPSFVSSVLLRVQPGPSSRSLMKMLKHIGPSVEPWGMLLTTVSCWCHFECNISDSLLHLSSWNFILLSVSMLWQTTLKAQADNYWSWSRHPLFSPYSWAIHVTAESCQVGQKLFLLCKFIMTTRSRLLGINFFVNGFQKDLLHQLHRDQDEAD